MKRQPKSYESRAFTGNVEVRAADDGKTTITGRAAVYQSLSENLGGFREIIAPGAFDGTDMDDVRGLFNHDENFVLGRTLSGTMTLSVTERGLEYEIEAPESQTIRDLVIEPMRRGDISQSSFGFIVGRGNDSWDEDEDGRLIRTIHRVQRLFDVSPVTFPAYPEATSGVRSMERYLQERAEQTEAEREAMRRHGIRAASFARRAQLIGSRS